MANLDATIQTLLQRLEQVTGRLEGVEKQLAAGGGAAAPSGGSSAAAAAGNAEAESSPSVVDFDALVNEHLKAYYDASEKIGAEVAEQANLVKTAIAEQRKLLVIAAQSKKPDDKTAQELLQPLSKAMGDVSQIKETALKNKTKFPNNLSTLAEGIAALGWVAVTPTPGPHINDMRGGSEFYSNRILKEFKGVDATQVAFVTGFNGFLKELFTYVKKHHTTGLSWNPRGGDAKAAAGSSKPAAAPKAAGGPPPPPPADFLKQAAAQPAQSAQAGPDMGNVFAAINKGTDVTSGLKKVTADMKSKNRTDKTSVVPASAAKPKSEKADTSKKGPAKLALEGNKWVVENQTNNTDIVIADTEPKHTVYVYRCDNSKIVIKGKINSVVVDDCKKSGVVFENAIASCEVVNCKGVEIQCTGKVPSIAIDKTSGIQLYLSADSLESEIVTSKSDSMNVVIPGIDDIVELPVPEQFKTLVRNNRLVTEAVQHV